MTNENEKTLDPTPNKPKRLRYDVGYCKPPKNSWFLPGTSGNPKGRPKGSKNKPKDSKLTDILRDELFCETESELRGEKQSVVRVVTQMLIDSALDGNFRAQQWVISASHAVEVADAAEQEADYQYAKAYKEKYGGVLFRDETLELIPNPDKIFLDHRHRRALFLGPRNAEEKAEFEDIAAELAQKSGTLEPDAEPSAGEEVDDAATASNQGPDSPEAFTVTGPLPEANDCEKELPAGPVPCWPGMDYERDTGGIRAEI